MKLNLRSKIVNRKSCLKELKILDLRIKILDVNETKS